SPEPGRHSFAAENQLYMALIDGARDQSVEKWFSGMEAAFISLLTRVEQRAFAPAPPPSEVGLSVLCAVSLGYRSGFDLREIERLLLEDEGFRRQFGEVEDPHRTALENMVNVITSESDRYRKATFIYDLAAPLLVCDRPLIVLPPGEGAVLPL